MSVPYQSVLFTLSSLILAGCAAVGPNYTPPSLPALPSSPFPSSFGAPPAGLVSGSVEVKWWRVFDDPALTTLIQRALAANHDIGIAAVRLEEAKAMLGESPVWVEAEQALFWVDILAPRLHRYDPRTGASTHITPPFRLNDTPGFVSAFRRSAYSSFRSSASRSRSRCLDACSLHLIW